LEELTDIVRKIAFEKIKKKSLTQSKTL